MAVHIRAGRVRSSRGKHNGRWKIWIGLAVVVVPLITQLVSGGITLSSFIPKPNAAVEAKPPARGEAARPSDGVGTSGELNPLQRTAIVGSEGQRGGSTTVGDVLFDHSHKDYTATDSAKR